MTEDLLNKGPRRRVVMIAKFDADDWETLGHELRRVGDGILGSGSMSRWSVSGGYSSGHIIVTSEDGDISHDSWAVENEAYVERLREQGADRG